MIYSDEGRQKFKTEKNIVFLTMSEITSLTIAAKRMLKDLGPYAAAEKPLESAIEELKAKSEEFDRQYLLKGEEEE